MIILKLPYICAKVIIKMIKWIAAFLGAMYWRFPGAILGFFVGYLIEMYMRNQARRNPNTASSRGYSYGRPVQVGVFNFEVNLLSLAAVVIKADGSISQRELDYVRVFFVQQFGKERANATFKIFNDEIKRQQIALSEICNRLRMYSTYEMRLQILHFLFGIANADGQIHRAEEDILRQITRQLNIHHGDFESIKAMFLTESADNAYKILEVDKKASEAEIKKAYREMVKKYHPDRLSGMDEAYIKGAREKFEKVQEAYDRIKKERGF